MKRQADFEVPCTAMMADGVFRGAILGTIWGAVTDLDLLESLISEPQVNSSRAVRRFNAIARSASGFAIFIGAYSGGSCLGEKLTGQPRDHWLPAAMGGFCGGSLFSVRSRNVALCLTIGSATGAFAGLVRYVQQH